LTPLFNFQVLDGYFKGYSLDCFSILDKEELSCFFAGPEYLIDLQMKYQRYFMVNCSETVFPKTVD